MTWALWSALAAGTAATLAWAAAMMSLVQKDRPYRWTHFAAFTTISAAAWMYVAAYLILEFTNVDQGDWSATMIRFSPAAFLVGWGLLPVLFILERKE